MLISSFLDLFFIDSVLEILHLDLYASGLNLPTTFTLVYGDNDWYNISVDDSTIYYYMCRGSFVIFYATCIYFTIFIGGNYSHIISSYASIITTIYYRFLVYSFCV